MESESRLVMIDYDLPKPELQYTIYGPNGDEWRTDFAWPEAMVCAEYESVAFHSGRDEMQRDRRHMAGIQQVGWTMVPIVSSDVRIYKTEFAARLNYHLSGPSRRKLA